jgi:hypothetical protein
METVAEKVFEPLREWAKAPIRVNSMFRSLELNKGIGGSATSSHMTGNAIYITSMGGKTNLEMFHYIKDNLDFDQLIWEFGDKHPNWIHVSYVGAENRNQILRAYKLNGKTKYELWKNFKG